jgi:hypothetical protein
MNSKFFYSLKALAFLGYFLAFGFTLLFFAIPNLFTFGAAVFGYFESATHSMLLAKIVTLHASILAPQDSFNHILSVYFCRLIISLPACLAIALCFSLTFKFLCWCVNQLEKYSCRTAEDVPLSSTT